jgi:hypothetical protein
MSTSQKILFFFVIPILAAPLLRPLEVILGILGAIITIVVLFVFLGFLLLRGSSTALTLSIFLQGLNVVTYILMFFPNATHSDGSLNTVYIITALISMAGRCSYTDGNLALKNWMTCKRQM